MTPPEMLFACNEAASSHPGTVAGVAKLRTVGHGKNVRVELNDIGRQFNQDIAPALIDLVEIASTRPLSKLKRWRLVRIVEAAPERGVDLTGEEVAAGGEQ